jgi:hypothetical protein
MLLAIAYGLLALLLVGVVASATAVHLDRKRLLVLADLAALEAADAVDVPAYYADPRAEASAAVRVEPGDVAAAVEDFLATAPEAARFTDLVVVEATSTDGRTARVTLRATARVPLLSVVTAAWSDGIELVVTTQARAG